MMSTLTNFNHTGQKKNGNQEIDFLYFHKILLNM